MWSCRTEGESCHLALSSQLCDEMELQGPIFVQNTRSLSGSRNAGILSQKALANPWKELSYFSFAGIPVKGDIPRWGRKCFLCWRLFSNILVLSKNAWKEVGLKLQSQPRSIGLGKDGRGYLGNISQDSHHLCPSDLPSTSIPASLIVIHLYHGPSIYIQCLSCSLGAIIFPRHCVLLEQPKGWICRFRSRSVTPLDSKQHPLPSPPKYPCLDAKF